MIKIGIISDSHHDLTAIDNAICLAPDVDCWIHAGDSISDTDYLSTVSQKQVFAVPGNIDWFYTKNSELLVNIADIKVFITHGHRYNVKFGSNLLLERAKQLQADLVIYGHSHIGKIETFDDITIANPGSIAQPRDGLAPSFMIAEIKQKNICLKRIFLK